MHPSASVQRRTRPFAAGVLLLAGFFLLAVTGLAQGRPSGGPGGGGPGGAGPGAGPGNLGGMNGGGFGRPGFPGNSRNVDPVISNGGSPRGSNTSSGLQLGPSGRWWDDKDFARNLGIDSRQQHRMDEVFSGNRGTLSQLYKNFQHEQEQLAKVVRGKDLDEARIFAQIDRVTQARGELEKANAHMLLQIRKEMTPEQTSRLDELRPPVE